MQLHIYICICIFFLISIYNQGPVENPSSFRRSTFYDEDHGEFDIYSQVTRYVPSNSSRSSIQRYSSSLSTLHAITEKEESDIPTHTVNPSIPTTISPVSHTNTTEQTDDMNRIHNHSSEEEDGDQEDLDTASSVLPSFPISNATLFSPCNSSRKPIVIQRDALYRLPHAFHSHVLDRGIVFYVYAPNNCSNGIKYMPQTVINAQYIKEMDCDANIAIVTNCAIPPELELYVDVIYRIHPDDIFRGKQWYTRVLYNAYPPFRLNFVLDTHVFPCDKLAVKELFDQFNNTDVDISMGNRMNSPSMMGAAALFRAGKGSHFFWKAAYMHMRRHRCGDDQSGVINTLHNYRSSKKFKFRWLSFNWAFASHGVRGNGVFDGAGKCYRTSLVVTGPVRFIHGTPRECVMMNGAQNEYVHQARCYYKQGKCNTAMKGYAVAFSESQYKQFVKPYKAANLYWNRMRRYSSTSLFWPERRW